MAAKFLDFWILCVVTLIGSVVLSWIGYRLKGEDLGLQGITSEIATALFVGAIQALLLLGVWKVVGWTHWLQFLVATAIAIMGYKLAHAGQMEGYAPFIIGIVQFILFHPANRLLAPIIGDMVRRFPMFA